MAANEELNEALRRAVEAETPAVLDAVLARADEPGREKAALPKRERRSLAAALGAGAAGVSAAAAVLAGGWLAIQAAPKPQMPGMFSVPER